MSEKQRYIEKNSFSNAKAMTKDQDAVATNQGMPEAGRGKK